MEKNSSLWKSLVTEHPLCTTWKQEAEGAIFHLASILFVFVHIAYQVHSITFAREFHVLYSSLFKPLGIPLPVFRTIALSSEVVTLEKEHCYAMQGKTSIDRLSVLVSG
ncbi:popeye domain-containing 3, isoform CRA_b, partial [Rattus norvegicus]